MSVATFTSSSDKTKSEEDCGVRPKYAKLYKERPNFQLYTTYSKPGIISIFSYDDQRSFHNWAFEVGTGQKRGRIREVIDHQINTPVLEIGGHHGGSVHMVCPSDADSTINVDMAYVTLLMRDILGYASVEFRVLDSLGFSRTICAKNFKSRCVIGELNCEIPMRLSPTWNYACVNLNETLQSAFGTELVTVQRIKINANLRIRRIYFHDEIFPFRTLPQEFRIKLTLSVHEKHEINKYEQFMNRVPLTIPEQNIPWCMPRLVAAKDTKFERMGTYNVNTAIRKHQFEILEVPLREDDSDKYTNVNAIGKAQAASNTGLLRQMLHKSIPPSKILLPTLSLIYPESKVRPVRVSDQNEASFQRRNRGTKLRKDIVVEFKCEGEGVVDETTEQLRKMKACIEQQNSPATETGHVLNRYVELVGENDNSRSGSPTPQMPPTDWERFHGHERGHEHNQGARPDTSSDHASRRHTGGHTASSHHHHHHQHEHQSPHKCGKYTVAELAQYLKYREVFGDYDMFTTTLGNQRFLEPPLEEPDEDEEFDEEFDELEEGSDSDEEGSEVDVQDMQTVYGHGADNPFLRVSNTLSGSPSIMVGQALVSQNTYRGYVGKYPEVDGEGNEEGEHGIRSVKSTESAGFQNTLYNKTNAREVTQSKLIMDDKMYSHVVENMNKNIRPGESKLIMKKAGSPFKLQQRRVRSKLPQERRSDAITELYRRAGPMLPQVMKQEFVNVARNSKPNFKK